MVTVPTMVMVMGFGMMVTSMFLPVELHSIPNHSNTADSTQRIAANPGSTPLDDTAHEAGGQANRECSSKQDAKSGKPRGRADNRDATTSLTMSNTFAGFGLAFMARDRSAQKTSVRNMTAKENISTLPFGCARCRTQCQGTHKFTA